MREMPGVHIDQNRCSHKSECAGKLPGFKVGGSWRFKLADIEAWIEIKKTKNKEI